MRAADRDYVGRRSGIDADAYTGITAGGEVDDSWLREVCVPVYLLGNFRVSPTHTDDTASSGGHQICGELDRCPGRVGVDLRGFDQEDLGVWNAKVSGEGMPIGCGGRVVARIDDRNRAPAACGHILAGGDRATRGSGDQVVHASEGSGRLIARRG